MAQAKAVQFVKSFVKGLITESGYLTYPEDASTDELNTVLHIRGNRTRRRGIDFEPDSTAISFPGFDANAVTSEFFWRSVGNNAGINWLVLQVGDTLHFFDASVEPLSAGKKSFTIPLTNFKSPTATVTDVRNARCEMSIGKGYLFVASTYIDPIIIEYNKDTGGVTATRVLIKIRDFDGVADGFANDAEPSYLTNLHHYNLRNQGWVRPGTNSVQNNYPTDGDTSTPGVGSGSGSGIPGDVNVPTSGGYGGDEYYYKKYWDVDYF